MRRLLDLRVLAHLTSIGRTKFDGCHLHSTDYREAFGLFDRVGDNKVAYNQIADIMRALGQNPTNKEVAKLLGSPSADGRKCRELLTHC